MKTILIVAGYNESLLNFRGDLIVSLLSSDYVVHVAAPNLKKGNETRSRLEALGAVVHDIKLDRNGLNPFVDMQTIFCLWKLIRKIRPEFFLPYTIKPVLYGLLTARFLSVPRRFALITGLGAALGGAPSIKQRAIIRLQRAALKGARAVIFQNSTDEKFFVDHKLVLDGTKTKVVNGSGVNLKSFTFSEPPTDPINFLMVARLLKAKGVAEFARAAKILKKDFPQATFTLAGWHENSPDFISALDLKSWVSEGTIEYLGQISDVRPPLKQSSVVVLPSYYPEGVPRTLLEALATGRPIITADRPGCRETVESSVNGYLIDPTSGDELVDACRLFLENPSCIKKMGQSSFELAQKKFDVNKVNSAMLSILEQ